MMRKCLLGFTFIVLIELAQGNFEDTRCRCICPSTEFFRTHHNSTSNEDFRRYYTKTNVNPLTCNTHNVVKDSVKNIVDENRLDAFLANCNCKFESRNSVLLKDVVLLVIVLMLALAGYMTYLLALDPMLRHGTSGTHAGGQFIPYRRQEDDVGFSSTNTFWFHAKETDSDYESDTLEDNVFSNSVATALEPQSDAELIDGANVSTTAQSSRDMTSISMTAAGAGNNDVLQLRGLGSRTVLNKVEAEQSKWMNSVEEQRRKVLTDHTMLN